MGFLKKYEHFYEVLDEIFKLFVSLFSIYLFNPFSKDKKITLADYYFAFIAGVLLLTSVDFKLIFNLDTGTGSRGTRGGQAPVRSFTPIKRA